MRDWGGGGLTLSTSAEAYTAEEHTLRDAQQGAIIAVEGEVLDYRFDEQPHMVFVHYRVRVDKVLLGEAPGEVEFTVPGGELANGHKVYVPGAPYLMVGEHVLLHGAAWGKQGTFRLNSWMHGVLREEQGLAFVGADRLPLARWGCDETRAVSAYAVPSSDHGHDDDIEPIHLQYDEPMPWADAVAIATQTRRGPKPRPAMMTTS